MALKDWKKVINMENSVAWVRKNNKKHQLTVFKYGNHFAVDARGDQLENDDTYSFKTKRTAMAYARAYMRKH